MTTDDRLIVDELVKIRDMADRLIATISCPQRNAPPLDVPPGDCASSRCRCNPENVKTGRCVNVHVGCPKCGKVFIIDDNRLPVPVMCDKCGKAFLVTDGEVGAINQGDRSGTVVPGTVDYRPKRKPGYPTECPACCSENIVKQANYTYYCVPCGNTFLDT